MNQIHEKLDVLGKSFEEIINRFDEKDRKDRAYGSTVKTFDWFQGVGLYGFYKLYKLTNEQKYLEVLKKYYEDNIEMGLPKITINSTAPMLALCFLNQELKNPEYDKIIKDWAEYIYNKLPRAVDGAFQHVTSESDNDNQLWDDTLMMTVLFMAKAGIVYKKDEYVEDSIYQFLEHSFFLAEPKTGLWYHGANVKEHHNFGEVFWGRGNSWVTVFIPEFLEILGEYRVMPSLKKYLIKTLDRQIESLAKYQDKTGLWHTVIDDETSYLETSCTAGFSYGILKAVKKGYIDSKYEEVGIKGIKAVMNNINDKGVLENVSGGTRMGMDKEFYKNIIIKEEPYGQAMAMFCLIEGLLHQ